MAYKQPLSLLYNGRSSATAQNPCSVALIEVSRDANLASCPGFTLLTAESPR